MSDRINPHVTRPCGLCRGWGFLPGTKDPDEEIDCPRCEGAGLNPETESK